ncbi:MAG: crotonobetainyl-CoA:carnitine CoA-transferase CaiB-like acyl-CoA transferase, partial [Cryomorphaceae bacterium]
AYDRIALAFAGFLNMTGYPDRPPIRPGTAVADYQSALFGAFGVMIALYFRDAKGGGGQHIDCSLYESIFRFTDIMAAAYDKLGVTRERIGNKHFAASPGDHYETIDGRYLCLTVAATNVFQRLCGALGREELAQDPRFLEHSDRATHYDEINTIVADWIKANPVDDVCAALEEYSVPHCLVYTIQDIFEDPHYEARQTIDTVDHPRLGKLRMQASQPRLSESPAITLKPAPDLGQHTDKVMKNWLDLDEEKLEQLRRNNTI